MATQKHLVLEDDVYRRLIQHRELTGDSMTRIGNRIIRSHMEKNHFEHVLGETLIQTGKITEKEYSAATETANAILKRSSHSQSVVEGALEDGTVLCGSWAVKEAFSPCEDDYQLLEMWARDHWEHAINQHTHDSDAFVVALDGRAIFILNGVPCTLRKQNVLHIPAGTVHCATPLDPESRLLVIMVPPVDQFSPEHRARVAI